MNKKYRILSAVAVMLAAVALVVAIHAEHQVVQPREGPPGETAQSITGTLDAISTNTELNGRSWYCYWFVDGEGLYRDTLVGTLVIPLNRTQPPWEEGKAYKVEYTIEPDWWTTIIAWEEIPVLNWTKGLEADTTIIRQS